MPRTLNQRMGDAHEASIAEWLKGRVQKGSGNQWHNQMDVVNDPATPHAMAGDGKSTLGKSISVTREMWAKAKEQTFQGMEPSLHLRFYADETLRKVDTDLTVVDSRFFAEVLHDAREWQAHQLALEAFEGAALEDLQKAQQDQGCDCCR